MTKMQKQPADWITVNGNHVPIFEGQSKKSAVSNFFGNKGRLRIRKSNIYGETISTGGKSGALNMDDPKDYEKAKAHAKKMYATFRNINSDIVNIAKHTGYTIEEISKIKAHVFCGNFDEDFDQAQTWDRLRKGIAVEADYIFIKHELEEMRLMEKGMSYTDAHRETEKTYNYAKAIKEYKETKK